VRDSVAGKGRRCRDFSTEPKLGQPFPTAHASKKPTYTYSSTLHDPRPTAKMAMKVPLLDEQDWNQPLALAELEGQDINLANNFCWYFHSSQFYEGTCNNSVILAHHREDPATNYILHDRKTFEERLRSIPGGLQYVVAGEPQGEGQPWLYQRQNRVRDAEDKEETFVEGNWYNRGTQVSMAPSLLDVVRARLVHPPSPDVLIDRQS
jgi:hypothetical protein